jgi:hypothetical protein
MDLTFFLHSDWSPVLAGVKRWMTKDIGARTLLRSVWHVKNR